MGGPKPVKQDETKQYDQNWVHILNWGHDMGLSTYGGTPTLVVFFGCPPLVSMPVSMPQETRLGNPSVPPSGTKLAIWVTVMVLLEHFTLDRR